LKTALTLPIPTSSPPKLIRSLPRAHPSGFPSISAVPTTSIVEDLEAALSQFAPSAADLKKQASPGLREHGSLSI
jgi:hypothetical protein